MLPYREPVASHWVTQVQERGDKLYQRGWKGSVDRRGWGGGKEMLNGACMSKSGSFENLSLRGGIQSDRGR